MMALEQCDYRRKAYITDFYLILDHLINTTKDVDLLSDEGIIDNGLGDSNAVTSMINNLNKGIFKRYMNSEFYDLCNDLSKFYEIPSHRWKATLKHKYFSTLWERLLLSHFSFGAHFNTNIMLYHPSSLGPMPT